jgi:uncharacterized damage-inducible protein DinB
MTRSDARPASVAAMSTLLTDAFEHHTWATERLLDACATLTDEQLDSVVPGTYGSIIATLRHTVQADSFYLMLFTGYRVPLIDQQATLGIDELRAANDRHAADYRAYLATSPEPDQDLPERDEQGWYHATIGIRLAQAIHHGTDHRSQVCTALTTIGIVPPDISVWDYGRVAGKTFSVAGEPG